MAPKPPSLSLKLIDLVNFSILHFQQAEVRADVKNPFVERQTGITKVRVVGQGSNLSPPVYSQIVPLEDRYSASLPAPAENR
jgi:hypothetical protein